MARRWGIARQDDDTWTVRAGDRVLGVRPDRDSAMTLLTSEFAAAPADSPDLQPGQRAFRIPLLVAEGIETGDGRFITPGALGMRDLPLPLMLLTETGWGHDGAVISGRIDTLVRVKSGLGDATGVYLDTDDGAMGAHLAEQQAVRGISADLDSLEVEFEEVGEPDDDGWMDVLMRVTAGRVMGATQCPMPAFQECTIECDPVETDSSVEIGTDEMASATRTAEQGSQPLRWAMTMGERHRVQRPLTAAAVHDVPLAPAGWFRNPHLEGPTPLTVTSDGRVFGHLCTWGTQHMAADGPLIPPRESDPDYPHFRLHAVDLDDGTTASVGHLTVGIGHAALTADARTATAHYDNAKARAAQVIAGNDEHGVWVAGWVDPFATPEQIYALRASALSGDWRGVGAKRELIAALAVNVAGFPIQRAKGHMAGGRPMSLVAAGSRQLIEMKQAVERHELEDVRRRIAILEQSIEPLQPMVASALLARYDALNA